jgi:hypothetical protein
MAIAIARGAGDPHARDVSVVKSNLVAVENLLSPGNVDCGTAAVPVHVFMMSGRFLPPSHPPGVTLTPGRWLTVVVWNKTGGVLELTITPTAWPIGQLGTVTRLA